MFFFSSRRRQTRCALVTGVQTCALPICADVGSSRGYVTAYAAETGKQLRRFWTVPGQPGVDDDETTRIAAESWSGEWWKYGGGGTVWNAITYDAELDTIYQMEEHTSELQSLMSISSALFCLKKPQTTDTSTH